MSEALFERIGGKEAVDAAVDKMYEKILADPLLAPFFDGVDMARQRRSQKAFVLMAFGGPNGYTGQHMTAAHTPLVEKGLSDEHFDAVASHLKESMEELGVSDDLIGEALAVVETTRDDVLGRSAAA